MLSLLRLLGVMKPRSNENPGGNNTQRVLDTGESFPASSTIHKSLGSMALLEAMGSNWAYWCENTVTATSLLGMTLQSETSRGGRSDAGKGPHWQSHGGRRGQQNETASRATLTARDHPRSKGTSSRVSGLALGAMGAGKAAGGRKPAPCCSASSSSSAPHQAP